MTAQHQHILLTGGSGLIGRQLTQVLLNKGYKVSHLSRKPGHDKRVKTYFWDIHKGIIDEKCVEDADVIIHLAGAGIVEKRWTDARKKELINSRVRSIGLIYQLLKQKSHRVKKIISASATGYYGDRGDELLTEDSKPGEGFLSECCIAWEKAVDEGSALGLDILKFRTGVVLSKDGGALPKLATPVKLYVGSPLGNGKQWMPWIHDADVVSMYLYGAEQENLTGTYNMTAPTSVTNAQLTEAVARQLKKPLWAPRVPPFLLKLWLGEMAVVVLGSTRTSAAKIEQEGFQFKYPDIEAALEEIYG
jgi:uncharacterized protein (TIGR01777 family)